jgi:hypothetical protein
MDALDGAERNAHGEPCFNVLGVQVLALRARLHVRLLLARVHGPLALRQREVEQVVGRHTVARRTRFVVELLLLHSRAAVIAVRQSCTDSTR